MSDRTAPLDAVPELETRRENALDPVEGSIDGQSTGQSDGPADFGDQEPTRFAADVEYRGRAQGHDYLVRVRHRFLDSSFTLVLDGEEHDPKAEEKAARKTGATEKGARNEAEQSENAADDDDSAGSAAADDGLRFRLEESFAIVHCTVRRSDEDGTLQDAEVLSVRTAGLGGAGEVDVRNGLERTLLVPADDSPSAVRDRKRTAHPTRYALVAALIRAAGFLLPLLGLGALFSGLLDPVKEWAQARVRPVIEAITEFVDPVREWIAGVLRPVGEFLDALFAPVREFLAAIWSPFAQAWNWLTDLLFGWIPDLSLPFTVPGWVIDVAVPVLVVLAVFAVTFTSLRHRHEKLEATREASDSAWESDDGARTPVDQERERIDDAVREPAGAARERDGGSATSAGPQGVDGPAPSSSRSAPR